MGTLRALGVRSLRLVVVQNVFSLFAEGGFLVDFDVQISEVVLCKAAIFHEAVDLVVDVLGERWLVSVLDLEFTDEHSFQLLSLLDIHEAFAASITHMGLLGSVGTSCTRHAKFKFKLL